MNNLELGPEFRKQHKLSLGVFYQIHELGSIIFIYFGNV